MTQHTTSRRLRWSLIAAPAAGALLLAGCTDDGGSDDGDATASGFSIMVAQANDQDDAYAQLIEQYSEETGIEIEVIDYPSDAYNTQVTTQLQAGNAADMMILAPGTGQAISIVPLAEAGFLEPLDSAASVIPAGSEHLYEYEGANYGQPTSLMPVNLVWNPDAAAEAGIDEFPTDFDALLEACTTARDGGKSFMAIAGSVPVNPGLLAQIVSATRVYAEDMTWNDQRASGDTTFVESDGWRQTLEDIVTLNDTECFQDGAAGGGFDAITNGVVGGTSLSAPVPGSAATSMNAAAEGLAIEVQSFPPASGDPFMIASANYAWTVNAAAEDGAKESAKAFVEWAGQPENAQTFADIFGAVPITGASADNLLAPYVPVADLLEAGSFSELPNASWPNPAVYDELAVGTQGLLTGQTTVDGILEAMDAAWDQ